MNMNVTFNLEKNVKNGNDGVGRKMLRNALASAHVNVLLGSAFSIETVPTLGHRESWFCAVERKLREESADGAWTTALALLKGEYFLSIMQPLHGARPTEGQLRLAETLVSLVRDRGSAVAPRRLNAFTTNYDPLLELALEELCVPFNDGFVGRDAPVFDPSAFSRLQYEQSLFMEYSSQVATVNVLKTHGSLTWRRDDDKVVYSRPDDTLAACVVDCDGLGDLGALEALKVLIGSECDASGLKELHDIAASMDDGDLAVLFRFVGQYDSVLCVVNPSKRKFEETLLERSYYDLLRIYANELDRNNALLLVFGFSFADEHIRELTVRAARSNPRLIIAISCYSEESKRDIELYFTGCENVWYIVPGEGGRVGLEEFGRVLKWATRR